MLYYNPGCALLLYKEDLALKVFAYLKSRYPDIKYHTTCCHHNPNVEKDATIINTCSGCDRRFSNLYDNINTITLWQVIDQDEYFNFVDYHNKEVSIHDACPIRHKTSVHQAVRNLLKKMNFNIIECANNSSKSICCGDSLYPKASLDIINAHTLKRAQSMPCDDVVVYCVSCIKSMYRGQKNPLYLVDLLFNEKTLVQEYDIVKWHEQVNRFIKEH